MIEKKIHYCWFGKNPLPSLVKDCIKSWEKYCPDYEIIEWNEDNFDVNQHPFSMMAYEHKAWAFVSDYARLKIIYEFGGVYLDTDVELLKSLNPLLEHEAYVGVEQGDFQINTGLGFGAKKNNTSVREMLEMYDDLEFKPHQVDKLACPKLNTIPFENKGFMKIDKNQIINNCMIYTDKYFCPYAPMTSSNKFGDDTYSIHHYGASWTSKKQILKRNFVYWIGAKNINYIKANIISGKDKKCN